MVAVDRADGVQQRAAADDLATLGVEARLGWPLDTVPEGEWEIAVTVPGVPDSSLWIRRLRERGVPVISELEFGWSRRGRTRTIAVTGSNGKSTLVKLLAECLRAAGLRAEPAGNYGPPVSRVIREHGGLDWLVLEVSSFQLETCDEFRPEVGIILNVHPNHLDRHGTYEAYRALKLRLAARQRPGDVLIVPLAQAGEFRAASRWRSRTVTFGSEPAADVHVHGGAIWQEGRMIAQIRGTWFDNLVLGPAAAAAAAALVAAGVDPFVLTTAARAFRPLPHRMTRVGEVDGVLYVNDSKSTSSASLAAALRMADRPVRLIAGGRAKERDFSAVRDGLRGRVRAVYLIGEAADLLASAWSDVVPCKVCGRLEAALDAAAGDARPGEMVLLSPACTSFDQYGSFEDRGAAFERWVRSRAEV